MYIKPLINNVFNLVNVCISFTVVFVILACDKSARDGSEAMEMLNSVKNWKIEQIRVNDKPVFKDGHKIEQFGSIEFDRYMSTVNILKDGRFEGKYNEGVAETKLKWTQKPDQIEVLAADTSVKGGSWFILSKDVVPDHFIMQTTTTAYDFPNTTKIELWYKAE